MPRRTDDADRRPPRDVTPPWTGAVFLVLSAVLLGCALVFDTGRTAFLAQSGAWLVVGLVVLAARRRRS